jgi:hypothetical protein
MLSFSSYDAQPVLLTSFFFAMIDVSLGFTVDIIVKAHSGKKSDYISSKMKDGQFKIMWLFYVF